MGDSEIILSGPNFSEPEIFGSVGELLFRKMKEQPKDFIVQVDDKTGETITAQEFLRQTCIVAQGLRDFKLKQGDVVAFACSSNIRSHASAIGILLAGGVFVPIDQTLKNYELQVLFKQFKPKLIICENEKAKEIQISLKPINVEAKIVIIDSLVSEGEFYGWEDIRTTKTVENFTPCTLEDPKQEIAMILCSSGTTGIPKGVALSHYSVLFNIFLTEYMYAEKLIENFLLTSPLFWLSGTLLLLNSCYFGQRRYIPTSLNPEDVLKGIEKYKPFFIMLAPSSLLALVSVPDFQKYNVSSVKVILSSGATLPPFVAEKFKQLWSGALLINCYGSTEVNGGITEGSFSAGTNSVGKLAPEVKVKIVDQETGKSLGPNKIGECRVKTKRVMNGYYNNEEGTNSAFDENGWYRTGDLVYYDEEGILYFVGRIKEAIEYQNFKIAPSEIESYIISLPGVKDVAVVPVPHEIDTNHLRALVVKDPASNITSEDIIQGVKENFTERKHLKEGVQFVDALPRTQAGKLRRLEANKMIKI